MDWNLAIDRNSAALKRIVAMLVAMAGLASLTSPLHPELVEGAGEHGSARRGKAEALAEPGEGSPVSTLPRHLHRAILGLLRPAESATRRLIIVMARGLVVTLPPLRPRKAKPAPTFLRKQGGTGILMARNVPEVRGDPELVEGEPRRTLALPLLDPLKPFRRKPRRPVANGIPRISFTGCATPSPIAVRRPPAPDDPLDAARLALRLQALGAALDDLPRQARRFARWKAARNRDAAGAQNKRQDAAGAQNKRQDAAGAQNKRQDAAGAQNKKQDAGRIRRVWPLRPGRPPGQRRANRRTHEVYEILNDLHGLAFDVLEHPDTS